jgi:molybdenum cofactor guanylyltransferase
LPRSSSSTSAVIFAGGRATRLGGANKALLDVGGSPIIDRILGALGPLVDERLVLTNDASIGARPGVRLVFDPEPHAGVLAALASGLGQARGGLCLAVACDMPFVSRALFEHLLDVQRQQDADVVIPRAGDYLEPMHAVYRREPVLAAVRAALARGQQRMVSYFPSVRVVEVGESEVRRFDPDLRAFFNVNTPADLAEAQRLAAATTP